MTYNLFVTIHDKCIYRLFSIYTLYLCFISLYYSLVSYDLNFTFFAYPTVSPKKICISIIYTCAFNLCE